MVQPQGVWGLQCPFSAPIYAQSYLCSAGLKTPLTQNSYAAAVGYQLVKEVAFLDRLGQRIGGIFLAFCDLSSVFQTDKRMLKICSQRGRFHVKATSHGGFSMSLSLLHLGEALLLEAPVSAPVCSDTHFFMSKDMCTA